MREHGDTSQQGVCLEPREVCRVCKGKQIVAPACFRERYCGRVSRVFEFKDVCASFLVGGGRGERSAG